MKHARFLALYSSKYGEELSKNNILLQLQILLSTPPSELVQPLDERYTHPDCAMHLLCARYKVSSLILFEIKRNFHHLAQLVKRQAVLTKGAEAAGIVNDIT